MSIYPKDMQTDFTLLSKKLLQRMPEPGDYPTPITGLVLHRRDIPNQPENCFNKPILAMTVQGVKRTIVGNKEYRYGAGHSLLAGVDMPNMSYLTQASPEKPYLVISLDLDGHLTSVLAAKLSKSVASGVVKGAVVMQTVPDILHAFQRLVALLDKPEQIPLLAPVILQEIHLQLLLTPDGEILKAINTQSTKSHHISKTINWLRDNFQQPLNVEALATMAHMAPSTFRKHFKTVTTMSPTEYHKYLRLYEAQRVMLENKQDVTSASYSVGYESITQFNREYKRLFGEPPQRDVNQLRATIEP